MPFQVMHPHHGLAKGCRQRTGYASTHQQRTGQTRPTCVGDRIHVSQRFLRLRHHLTRQRHDPADVVTAGQLGHHPTIGLVHVYLAVQRVGQQARHVMARRVHQRYTCFITTRFKSNNQHGLSVSVTVHDLSNTGRYGQVAASWLSGVTS